jgi:ribosomal protein S18 acetylase RimI-like enzyme
MSSSLPVIEDATAADLVAIREMLHEYADWLKVDLCFQGFDAEVAGLPGDYAPPSGALLIARLDGRPAGMVALRRKDEERCEMKRLFVREAARGSRLGRALADRIIAEARSRGYREMVLDTLPLMQDAQRLYVALGFRDIEPYYSSPIAGTRFMALTL